MKKSVVLLVPVLFLTACGQTGSAVHGYGDDALPSAEVLAFQAADARLRWTDARIEHDEHGCAIYQGRDPQGQIRREPLSHADGKPLCTR